MFGLWPIATNSPVTGRSARSPVWTSSTTTWSSLLSPTISVTTEFHRISILGLEKARSCMILLARSWSRRTIIVTLVANFVRNMASSTAESPPPTTAISWSRKKKPSQVAHVDTPWPISRPSFSSPSISDCAPVARISERPR